MSYMDSKVLEFAAKILSKKIKLRKIKEIAQENSDSMISNNISDHFHFAYFILQFLHSFSFFLFCKASIHTYIILICFFFLNFCIYTVYFATFSLFFIFILFFCHLDLEIFKESTSYTYY